MIKINSFCEILYDGRLSKSKVININDELKTFDVITSFNEKCYNIPFYKYKPIISLGNEIVNSIEKEFNLSLMTVDAAAMTDCIDIIIYKNKWRFNI